MLIASGAHVRQFAGSRNVSALCSTEVKGVLFQSKCWRFSAVYAGFKASILDICIIVSVASICGTALSHNYTGHAGLLVHSVVIV